MYTKISLLVMAFLLSAIFATAQPTLQQITPQYGETNAELMPEIVFVTSGGEPIVPTSVHERSPELSLWSPVEGQNNWLYGTTPIGEKGVHGNYLFDRTNGQYWIKWVLGDF